MDVPCSVAEDLAEPTLAAWDEAASESDLGGAELEDEEDWEDASEVEGPPGGSCSELPGRSSRQALLD